MRPQTSFPVTSCCLASFIFLLSLVCLARGQGSGTIELAVAEGKETGTLVGSVNVAQNYAYTFQDQSDLFEISQSGNVTTSKVIDREKLSNPVIQLVVIGSPVNTLGNTLYINLEIRVTDVNDNSPSFASDGEPERISFQEDARPDQGKKSIAVATDPDEGSNGEIVAYDIISGNEDGLFGLDESGLPLILYVVKKGKESFDREKVDGYRLNISAQDGGNPSRFGYLSVDVTILDVNDEAPAFDLSEYITRVNESAPVNSQIFKAEATDDDIGLNGEIFYQLEDSTRQFRIEEDTGVIRTLVSPLVCEASCTPTSRPNCCFIIVIASDRGLNALTGRVYVKVEVLDENDHDPEITFVKDDLEVTTVSIDENVAILTPVVSISITDEDSGPNGDVTVRIVKGNEDGYFSLLILSVPTLAVYEMRINKTLDRETLNRFNLTIEASDNGTPPRTSVASLIILVSDANDHFPEFLSTRYEVAMSELAKVNSFVANVKAMDKDEGVNSLLTYAITTGNDLSWFHIDPQTGLVTTKGYLDHETESQITLNISAHDGGADVKYSYTSLVISIMDENDVAPTFNQSLYVRELSENMESGAEIMQLVATDNDEGLNSTVEYLIHPDTQQMHSGAFDIGISSGRLESKQRFDREDKSEYLVKIIARDRGTPPLSSTASVRLIIKDVNDNSPLFAPEVDYVNVFDTDPVGVPVIRVTATDRDIGEFGKVSYSLKNFYDTFKIDRTSGVISTARPLTRQEYSLTVTAVDGGQRSSEKDATVNIIVTSTSSSAPTFLEPSYIFTITEDNSDQEPDIGKRVGQVWARTSPSSPAIQYAITGGDTQSVFQIDQDGWITTRLVVDREQKEEYSLTVIAFAGEKISSRKVTILVDDVNDNGPVFTSETTEAKVLENWPVGHNVFLAQAVDLDKGANQKLIYTLTSNEDSEGIFTIDSSTGVISLARPPKLMRTNPITLTVTAKDSSSPQREESMNVKIHLIDENDHTPLFTQSQYELFLSEYQPVNEMVIMMSAMDSDEGRNSDLTYSLIRGNEERKFGIFPNGALYVAYPLDRETRDMYSLTVLVQDSGVVPRSSSVNISIYVIDENDNVPRFDENGYEFSIKENVIANTYIGSVKATDLDSGQNAEVIYTLAPSNSNFTINPITGALYSKRSFDREYVFETSKVSYYTFDVIATDNGSPKLQHQVTVKVNILDENDNIPQFSEKMYTTAVRENLGVEEIIFTVTAADADEGINAAVSYSISGGNEDDKFKINAANGQILLKESLDRETKGQYLLTIKASDTGANDLQEAEAQLRIFVIDYNDNTPEFKAIQSSISVSEQTKPGETLIVFEGTDKDIGNNGKLRFDIVSGNEDDLFRLDLNSGKLYLARELDYDKGRRSHNLNITVSDSGYPALSTAMMFTVRVIDANDNTPRFLDGISKIHVNEDDSVLGQIQAEDLDSGNYGRIVYSIYKQTPAGDTFEIDGQGKLSLKGTLDREKIDKYYIVIHAVDQDNLISQRKTAERTLTIVVRDVNDNSPVFQSPSVFLVPYPSSQGTTIATLSASDADDDGTNKMVYSFSGPKPVLFNLNPTSGTLSLAQNLPPTPLTYSITILASDHDDPNIAMTTSHTIKLLLYDSSGTGPEFTNMPDGSVSENVRVGTTVTSVSARPSRAGLGVSYHLTRTASARGDFGGVFVVDEDSGTVTTGRELDSEQLPSEFTLDISAVETEGMDQRVTTIQVSVSLTDLNDNPPVFASSLFDATVPENGPPGASVARILVTDPDVTGKVSLSLNGQEADDFSIDEDGVLISDDPLDYEKDKLHQVRVDAWDGAHRTSCFVHIKVQDENDHAPEFTKPFYSFDLSENSPQGHTIGMVLAIDSDSGNNGHVVYDLVSDWGTEYFRLDTVLGELTLIKEVDYEERHVYILKVLARDEGVQPQSSEVTVYLNVKDVNDNQPEFDPMTYSMEIREDADVGTAIVNVSATDVDSDLNGDIRYSLVGEDAANFGIGPINGSIYTTAALDRELRPVYTITVMATDQAKVKADRLSTTSTVDVKLKDVNDSPPKFTSPSDVYIREDATLQSTVFTVTADDLDEGINGRVTFTLVSQTDFFSIDSQTGALKLEKKLDRETSDRHSVEIQAKDGGSNPFRTRQTLVIHVQDANDNAPNFTRPMRQETVSEDVAVGKSLLRVFADDKDEGLNGAVRYFIVDGIGQHDFHLDMSSGVLRVQKKLDYERTKEYTLTIQAEDSSVENPLRSNSTIVISVADVNDFIPVFDNSPYHTFVQEGLNADMDVPIFNITARDEDSGYFGRVQYNLRNSVDYPGVFEIDVVLGQVKVLKSLDREATPQYVLTIIAIDGGIPSQTGTTTLTVFVKDVNDHSPVFEGSGPYVAHVRENLPVATPIMTVSAADIDEGINSHIIYSLEDTKHGRFAIDPHTGQLATAAVLDRELDDHYQLTVVATDQGIPPRSAMVEVQVIVKDDNDHPPDFRTNSYSVVIYDSSNTADFVLGVTAIDRDVANNGKVVYSLEGPDSSSFHISSETGVITHATSLKENGRTFNFIVRASDLGTVPLNSTASVTVQMASTPSSEERPIFQEIPPSLEVKENRQTGTLLTTVRATSTRSNGVTYHIAGGNVNNAFSIHSGNGSILVAGQIDFEVTSRFQLWIEARDQGQPSLSAFHEVTVNVEDKNDNAPVFSKSIFQAEVTENCRVGTSVSQVVATDLDSGSNQQLVYTVKDGNTNNTFRINRDTGLITTINPVVDRERIPFYALIVEAADMGEPKLSTSTTVRVVIGDANDNQPTFTGSRSVAIPEDLPIGSLVMRLTTNDKDVGANARARYTFVLNNGVNLPFEVDPESGNISSTGKLDAESTVRYRPEVSVTDGSFIQQTSLTIRLLDVNDNAPQFQDKRLTFDFMELQNPNALVGKLTALDIDITSPNNKFFFSLKRPSSLFELHAETGDIIALEQFHFFGTGMESMNEHVLEAVVTDLGVPSLSSETTVVVRITDFNDHAPVFDQDTYFSAVPVNLATDESILYVHAEDKNDFGRNAEISYSFISGDGMEFFSIDAVSGAISPKVSLAGRQNQKLSLIVKAEDKGDSPQSSTATVEMEITPINNQTPRFSSTTSFTKTIREDAEKGYLIETIRATDSDPGLNGNVRYSIASGNELDLFEIGEDDGRLTVKGALDYETQTVHRIKITARDRGLFHKEVSQFFEVRLEDVNDNAPYFEYSYYDAYIAENADPIRSFFRLNASDADTKDENIQIRYSITGSSDANAYFQINAITGELSSANVRFDYERRTLYTLLIMAHNPDQNNNPVKKSVTTVYVHVTGVNENKPKFVKDKYTFTMSESADTGTSVGSVSAVDSDKGPDGVVYYFLEGPSNLKGFSLESLTGIIRVAERADYESSPYIILTVLAKNSGSIRGRDDTDTAQVNITVSDANDPPEFKKSKYTASIPENSDGSFSVIQVEAEDKDVQPSNRQFTYRILDGDQGKFRINPTTGNIDTAGLGVLDRETTPVFTLIVGAEDTGNPPMTGTTTVEVQLTDRNDNGPQFDPLDLTVYVSENETTGVLVTTLKDHTIDLDLPPNQGPYKYRIVDGPASQYFRISEQTGRVETKQSLTREQGPQFRVPVVVRDNGFPTMSSTLTFTVIVRDSDSSPPKPRPLSLHVNVLEGGRIDGKIGDVRPLDSDPNREYICTINGVTSNFIINSGCELRVAGDISPGVYVLPIIASNSKFSPITYDVTVTVEIVSSETLENTAAVLIKGINGARFLESAKYESFKNTVEEIFGPLFTCHVYGLKEEAGNLYAMTSVRSTGDVVLPRDDLIGGLGSSVSVIEARCGVKIITVAADVCSVNPCANGGSCTSTTVSFVSGTLISSSSYFILTTSNMVLSPVCSCTPAFTGRLCNTSQERCGADYCSNEGRCVDGTCECPDNWQGEFCKEDVNECQEQPSLCKNNGECQNRPGDFECECVNGYHGKLCELQNYCATEPCSQYGTCVEQGGSYQCRCQYGYYGLRCQHSSMSFEEQSYLVFSPVDNYKTFNASMYFATTMDTNALLMFSPVFSGQGSQGFVAMEIVGGRVRVSFRLAGRSSGEEMVVLSTGSVVNNGHWHRVEFNKVSQVQTANLIVQRCDVRCTPCAKGRDCYNETNFLPSMESVQGRYLTLGGVREFEDVLDQQGDVAAHDFVGCLHSVTINGRSYVVNRAEPEDSVPMNTHRVGDRCPRNQAGSSCDARSCFNGGKCEDDWSSTSCHCPVDYTGPECREAKQPFTLGSNGAIRYTLKPSFVRDSKLAAARAGRRRRAVPNSSIMIRFRTTKKAGVLHSSRTETVSSLLWFSDDKMHFLLKSNNAIIDPLDLPKLNITDKEWHNVTVKSEGTRYTMDFDGKVSRSRDFGIEFDFDSLDIVDMSLSGKATLPDNTELEGFDGCLSRFLINGNPLPMNGSSEKYSIQVTGEVGSKCLSLCDGNPCGGSNNCVVDGEEYTCMLVAKESDGLETGIIVIIVFFVILIVAIVVVFILFHRRRDLFNRCVKTKKQNRGPSVSGSNSKAMTNSDSMVSAGVGSRYAHHNPSEEEIIRGHIMEELSGQKSSSLSTRPDLIGHSYSPQMLTDGVMIMDPDDMQIIMDEEGAPEHYDFENASSIAPSDIAPSEVIRHYRDFRNGTHPHHHHHHNTKNPHSSHLFNKYRDSPTGMPPNNHRGSPHMLPPHSMQPPRQSPISLTGSAMSVPAHSSPSVMANVNGGRPSSALASLNQPPRSRMSPLTQLHVRSPRTHPHNNYNYNSSAAYSSNNARDSRSNSIGSHHSHSSSSSATGVPNGFPANQSNQKYSGNKPGGRSRPPKGLTVEDVNRLNARPDMLMHGTSSSPEGKRRGDRAGVHLSHQHPGLEGSGSLLLEPPDSSSEDSGANDSFTCSEFEYDNDTARARLDLDPSKMIFSKLTEVDNECDEPIGPVQGQNQKASGNADGLNSNGDSFTSTNASSSNSPSSPIMQPISSQYDFDALLNWGPNFDKLVGVFSDIAQLPDSGHPVGGATDHDYEEYV